METVEINELPFGESIPQIKLDKEKLEKSIDGIIARGTLEEIKDEVKVMIDQISFDPWNNSWSSREKIANGKTYKVDHEIFLSNLNQIYETQTVGRIRYYLERLKKSITKVKTGKVNDINLNRWKEYEELRTDSLWVDKKRDRSGKHIGTYWGNFIPQIPYQMMMRYTKAGDFVLDTFAGSGTTLIECRRLGRNGVGFELNPNVAQKAQMLVDNEENRFGVRTEIVKANSVSADYEEILGEKGIKKVQLVIMHPPYFDIIRFSDNEDDLSNAQDVQDFLDRLEIIGKKSHAVLEKGRYACLVIGDKYQQGEWIPLGFLSMQKMTDVGFRLKSIIVKNFDQTKGKRSQEELWRYRALVGGYYIFKHEYIFLFQKD